MPSVPYRKSPDVFEQYSRLGEAIGKGVSSVGDAFVRGQELGRKFKIQDQEIKVNENMLRDYEESKENLEMLKDQALQTIKVEEPNIAQKRYESFEKNIKQAKSGEEVKAFMYEYAQDRANSIAAKQKYGNAVKFTESDSWLFSVKGSAKIADARRQLAVNDFQTEGMRDRFEAYMKTPEGQANPNAEGFTRFLFQGEPETAVNKEFRETIKDMFVGELDRKRLAIAEKQAATARLNAEDGGGSKKVESEGAKFNRTLRSDLIAKQNTAKNIFTLAEIDTDIKVCNLADDHLTKIGGGTAQTIVEFNSEYKKSDEYNKELEENELKRIDKLIGFNPTQENWDLFVAPHGKGKMIKTLDQYIQKRGITKEPQKEGLGSKLKKVGGKVAEAVAGGDVQSAPGAVPQTEKKEFVEQGGKAVQNDEAMKWAIANPQDPRAKSVLKKLGYSDEEINKLLGQ